MKKPTLVVLLSFFGLLFLIFAGFSIYFVESNDAEKLVSGIKTVSAPFAENYFPGIPKDAELKAIFQEHRADFYALKEMIGKDDLYSVSAISILKTSDGKPCQYPYAFGDKPACEFLSRDRFEKYVSLMKSCKIIAVTDTRRLPDAKSQSVSFRMYYKPDYSALGKKKVVSKYLVHYESDDFSSKPETDSVDLTKNDRLDVPAKIEPHWYVYLQQSVL